MSVTAGDRAPGFSVPGTQDGERRTHTLEEHAGHPVVLVFYPGDNTPVCTRQLNAYTDDIDQFLALGAQILAFSPEGRRLAACGGDSSVHCWDVPNPVDAHAERVSCWVRVVTNLEFDEGGAIRRMDGSTSWDLRRRLTDLGGPPLR